MNKLKDMKEYLINKIETRFFELTKDVQKGVQVKKKAIDNRIKFLDRNFLQVNIFFSIKWYMYLILIYFLGFLPYEESITHFIFLSPFNEIQYFVTWDFAQYYDIVVKVKDYLHINKFSFCCTLYTHKLVFWSKVRLGVP